MSKLRESLVGYNEVSVAGLDVYYNEAKLSAIGLSSNKDKDVVKFRYRFRNVPHMMEYIAEQCEIYVNRAAEKQAAKEAKANFKHSLSVGDVMYSSWGYEQTNIDFYQVVGVKGKSVVIRQIAGNKVSEDGWLSGKVSPVVDAFVGDEMRKLVSMSNSLRLNSFSSAWVLESKMIDGEKVYNSKEYTSYY